jgi:hypothetical protein
MKLLANVTKIRPGVETPERRTYIYRHGKVKSKKVKLAL